MSTLRSKIKTCRDFIAISNTDNAIKIIIEIKELVEIDKNHALILSNRWVNLSRSKINGVISEKDFETDRISINNSILQFLDKIEDYYKKNSPEYIKTLEKQVLAEKKIMGIIEENISKDRIVDTLSNLSKILSYVDFGDCSPEVRKEIIDLRNICLHADTESTKNAKKFIFSWNPFVFINALNNNNKIFDGFEETLKRNRDYVYYLIEKKEKIITEEKGI